MNGHKLHMLVLVVGGMLVLLLTTACSAANVIGTPDGQALSEQGDAYMACLKEKDLDCADDLMSSGAKGLLKLSEEIANVYVDLDSVVEQAFPTISSWSFDRAEFSIRVGGLVGALKGKVEYANGEQGRVRLELVQEAGIWKVRSSDLALGPLVYYPKINLNQ
jgi:hypothetical protein